MVLKVLASFWSGAGLAALCFERALKELSLKGKVLNDQSLTIFFKKISYKIKKILKHHILSLMWTYSRSR
jgi:hypothetical protein